jgi:hypothetical protein
MASARVDDQPPRITIAATASNAAKPTSEKLDNPASATTLAPALGSEVGATPPPPA